MNVYESEREKRDREMQKCFAFEECAQHFLHKEDITGGKSSVVFINRIYTAILSVLITASGLQG